MGESAPIWNSVGLVSRPPADGGRRTAETLDLEPLDSVGSTESLARADAVGAVGSFGLTRGSSRWQISYLDVILPAPAAVRCDVALERGVVERGPRSPQARGEMLYRGMIKLSRRRRVVSRPPNDWAECVTLGGWSPAVNSIEARSRLLPNLVEVVMSGTLIIHS